MNSVAAPWSSSPQSSPVSLADDGSSPLRVAALHVYPVKSCGGVALRSVAVATTGLAGDRQWMVVDAQGQFVTQRDEPRLALIRPREDGDHLVLAASGVADLRVSVDAPLDRLSVQVWNDRVDAVPAGAAADAWLSNWLGRSVRLVRFDLAVQRLSNPRWTGDLAAANAFSDGFPILVISQASLDALNDRLHGHGQPSVTMDRFRPNLVIDGVDAHAEDGFDELHINTPDGPVVLRLVKPCPRCPVPNIDQHTAERGTEPGDTLASYRADPRVDGAITFGMNAVIVEGIGRTLAVGQAGRGTVAF